MTQTEKNEVWTMCLNAACKRHAKPDGRIGDFFLAKTEAQNNFKEFIREIGDGSPDFSGVRERLGF